MAHFAQLNDNNEVIRVVVISNDDLLDETGTESESLGVAVCEQVIEHGRWVQTSYNNRFRKQYASLGMTYDETRNMFISPKPFMSWVLDENGDWQSPKPMPTDGGQYEWNETTKKWEAIPTE